MISERTLIIPSQDKHSEDTAILFRQISTQEDLDKMHTQRYRVYAKYGYLNLDKFDSESDVDIFDQSGSCTYIGAWCGDRLLGSVRAIRSDILPIEKFFEFRKPVSIENYNTNQSMELSRLVIERTDGDKDIPRNIVMLFMTDMLLDLAQEANLQIGYAYLKERLINKMRLLRMPTTTIGEHTCIYPKDGPMSPYFYDHSDDMPIPSFFIIDEIDDYMNNILSNKHMFDIIDEEQKKYRLKNSVYNKFLKTLKVL